MSLLLIVFLKRWILSNTMMKKFDTKSKRISNVFWAGMWHSQPRNPDTNEWGFATLFCARKEQQSAWPSVLRIRIRDPVPFWSLDPGWVKNQDPDPVWATQIIFLRAYKQFFGLKYLNFLMGIRDGKNLDPGWKKFGSGINIPDPTLLTLFYLVDDCVDGLQGLEPWTKYI